MKNLPRNVARKIGHYVYLYVDPRNNKVFYVGKGKGQRAFAHLNGQKDSRNATVIRQLRRAGLKPRIDILAHKLSEETALRIEAAAIDLLGLDKLTNEVRGWHSIQLGRMPLLQIKAYYAPRPARIKEPAILIRINRLYKHGMPPGELYDATRGVWRVRPNRAKKAQLAFAIFEGLVQEVYKISKWEAAGSTRYATRLQDKLRGRGRWEFVGKLAPAPFRNRYIGRDVSKYLRSQYPISYVNV